MILGINTALKNIQLPCFAVATILVPYNTPYFVHFINNQLPDHARLSEERTVVISNQINSVFLILFASVVFKNQMANLLNNTEILNGKVFVKIET